MKKKLLIISLLFGLTPYWTSAQFGIPFGSVITGRGAAPGIVKDLISRYNAIFPCPTFSFSQSSTGVSRVLDRTINFAVTSEIITSDCILQIPFAVTSLSFIYHVPNDFSPTNASWPGHLNLFPNDLCLIYTGAGESWATLLIQSYNGGQVYGGSLAGTNIKAYARSDSAEETGLFVRYLVCSGPASTGPCTSFLAAANVQANQNGPFCATGAPGQWNTTNVSCLSSSAAIANAVKLTQGTIGYVGTDVAATFGFPFPTTALTQGFPLGVAGLYDNNGSASLAANYVQPDASHVLAAIGESCSGEFLCVRDAYPIVYTESFVLTAMQPVDLIACNLAQFIQFALTEGQFATPAGTLPLPSGCINLSVLDQIHSAICRPCIEPCNPCANQTCKAPCALPCS